MVVGGPDAFMPDYEHELRRMAEPLGHRLIFTGDRIIDASAGFDEHLVKPPALDAIVAKALAKAPADRHASAAELAAAVRGALGHDREM